MSGRSSAMAARARVLAQRERRTREAQGRRDSYDGGAVLLARRGERLQRREGRE